MIREFLKNLLFGVEDSRVQLERDLKSAIAETEVFTAKTGESLCGILKNIECAKKGIDVNVGFQKLNEVMRSFKRISTRSDDFEKVKGAIKRVGVSDLFYANLQKGYSLDAGIERYKVHILQNLALQEMVREREDTLIMKQDENLFKRFLPSCKSLKRKLAVERKNVKGKSKKRRLQRQSKRRNKNGYSAQEWFTMRQKGICFYFPRGNCKRGELCNFKHIKYLIFRYI